MLFAHHGPFTMSYCITRPYIINCLNLSKQNNSGMILLSSLNRPCGCWTVLCYWWCDGRSDFGLLKWQCVYFMPPGPGGDLVHMGEAGLLQVTCCIYGSDDEAPLTSGAPHLYTSSCSGKINPDRVIGTLMCY